MLGAKLMGSISGNDFGGSQPSSAKTAVLNRDSIARFKEPSQPPQLYRRYPSITGLSWFEVQHRFAAVRSTGTEMWSCIASQWPLVLR
jgi:hypothetical protein